MKTRNIFKKHNHDHFWIQDGVLFETYKTIRGLRYMSICECGDVPDNENVSDEEIKQIENNLTKH